MKMYHLKILTLSIYGLVLFQSAEGMIYFETVNMSKSVVSLKINPVVAVSTENLSSLNHCRKTKKRHLRCCLLLCFVWIISHWVEGNIFGLLRTPWHLYLKLDNRIAIKGVGKEYLGIHISQFERVCFSLGDSTCLFSDIFGLV